jgi:hypothetical protein
LRSKTRLASPIPVVWPSLFERQRRIVLSAPDQRDLMNVRSGDASHYVAVPLENG